MLCNTQLTESSKGMCEDNFCSYCCKNIMPKPWLKYKLFNCEKTCYDNTAREDSTFMIDRCVEPDDASKTMYS